MQPKRNELDSNVLEALRALTDWGRDNTSPRDPNSPHSLLVRAAEAIAEADRLRAEATANGEATNAEDTVTYTLRNGEKVVHHRLPETTGVVRVTIEPSEAGWVVLVTKAFGAQHGGGETVFPFQAETLAEAMKLATAATVHYNTKEWN